MDNGSFAQGSGPVSLSQSPSAPYPLGTTNVTLTVAQGADSATCHATVNVGDCNPPTMVCPPPTVLECAPTSDNCTPNPERATATDSCRNLGVSDPKYCEPLGTSTVTYNATSVNGLTSSCSSTVTVVDSQPPVITPVDSARPIELTPVDGTLRQLSLLECGVAVRDVCDSSLGLAAATITCVNSDQDGGCVRNSNDIQIIDDQTLVLRAQANTSGQSRNYTIHFEVTDHSSNTANGVCLVTVPGSGGQGGTGGGAGGQGGEGAVGGGGAGGGGGEGGGQSAGGGGSGGGGQSGGGQSGQGGGGSDCRDDHRREWRHPGDGWRRRPHWDRW